VDNMQKILFLGDHKGLFKILADAYNSNPQYGIEIYQKSPADPKKGEKTCPDLTPYEPDLIVCFGGGRGTPSDFIKNVSWSGNYYWHNITLKPTTKLIRYGGFEKWFDIVADNYDCFSTMAVEEAKKVPYGKFKLMPLPLLYLTDLPQTDLNDGRSLKIMQGMDERSQYKYPHIARQICKELRIEYECIFGLSRRDYLDKINKETFILVDNFWRGEIGMVTWEALAMGIPVITYVSQQTQNAYTQIFGSFPPIINISVSKSILQEMSIMERDEIAIPAIKQSLQSLTKDNLVNIGKQSREWIQANYNKEKILDMWSKFLIK